MTATNDGTAGQNIDPIDARIGTLMRERRRELRLSRAALGSGVGLSPEQIGMYERGRIGISASHLATIAHQLGVEPTWFFDALTSPTETGTPEPVSEERRVAEAFARIDKPAVRASFIRLIETMALQSATWTKQPQLRPQEG